MKVKETKREQLMEIMEVKRKVTRAGTIIGPNPPPRKNTSASSGRSLEDKTPRTSGLIGFVNPIYDLDGGVLKEVIEEEPAGELSEI